MWKIIIAFALFASLSMFVIMQGGDNLNMAGEQHGGDAAHEQTSPSQAESLRASDESTSHAKTGGNSPVDATQSVGK